MFTTRTEFVSGVGAVRAQSTPLDGHVSSLRVPDCRRRRYVDKTELAGHDEHESGAALLKRFGASVRRERVRLKMTQEQLAEQVGFYPRTVQKIEAGEINVPLTTLARLQAALGCEWAELLGK